MESPKNSLYGQQYTELYQQAPHRKILESPTFKTTTKSPACGDEVTFFGVIKEHILEQLTFQSSGSMLSHIYAELLCQYAEGKTVSEIANLTEKEIQTILPLPISGSRFALIIFITNSLKEGISPHA